MAVSFVCSPIAPSPPALRCCWEGVDVPPGPEVHSSPARVRVSTSGSQGGSAPLNVHARTCAVGATLHCALPSRSRLLVPPTPGKPRLVSTDGHAGSRFMVTAVRESSCHGWTRRSPLIVRSYDEHPWMCRGRTVSETVRGLLGRRRRGRGAWGPPSRTLPCAAVSSLRGGPRFSPACSGAAALAEVTAPWTPRPAPLPPSASAARRVTGAHAECLLRAGVPPSPPRTLGAGRSHTAWPTQSRPLRNPSLPAEAARVTLLVVAVTSSPSPRALA